MYNNKKILYISLFSLGWQAEDKGDNFRTETSILSCVIYSHYKNWPTKNREQLIPFMCETITLPKELIYEV
jgi:hypothetical protein